MLLTFRPIKVWPEGWRDRKTRKPSPFQSTYSKTLRALDTELVHLDATECTLQVDATDRDLRLDGQLRADAKVNHPGVILTIETKRYGTLTYPCDTFESRWASDGPSWQVNLRAIALGLEALRKVERYGIANRGQQYAGYRELGTGIELGRAPMTLDEAAVFLVEHSDNPDGACGPADLLGDDETIAAYFREAAKRLHPDVGGDPEMFKRLTESRDLLIGHAS